MNLGWDGISFSSVYYAKMQDAIHFIKLADPGSFLTKTDTKNACQYLRIPIAPEKLVVPQCSIIRSFAGIELDTVQSEDR